MPASPVRKGQGLLQSKAQAQQGLIPTPASREVTLPLLPHPGVSLCWHALQLVPLPIPSHVHDDALAKSVHLSWNSPCPPTSRPLHFLFPPKAPPVEVLAVLHSHFKCHLLHALFLPPRVFLPVGTAGPALLYGQLTLSQVQTSFVLPSELK